MFDRVIKKFAGSIKSQIFVLAVFATAFFHNVFRMEFWKDDYGLLYDIQQSANIYAHTQEYLKYFVWPYQHFARAHEFLYNIFRLNPLGYFSFGILIFFISAVVFYFFIYELFSKKTLAFIASLIYLTSPIGIDDMFMMVTFLTGCMVILLFIATLFFLCKFYKQRRIIYYFISILSLIISFEFLPNRTFYLPLIVFIFEFIYFEKKRDSIKNLFLRQLILLTVSFFFFYISPRMIYSSLALPNSTFENILNYKLLLNPILTFMNMIYGGLAYLLVGTFNFYNNARLIGVGMLIITLVCCAYFILKFKNKEHHLKKSFFFSIIYLFLTPLAFYAFSQREISVATFRYLHPGLPAYGLLVVCVYIFLVKITDRMGNVLRLIPSVFLITILLLNSYSVYFYIKEFNSRAFYAREFIRQFTGFIPNLPKNSAIYFKLSDDPEINYRLIDSIRVGVFNDDAYFAVRYNLHIRDVNPAVTDFSVLLNTVKKKQIKRENIFGFEYGKNGLKNITREVRMSVDQAFGKLTKI